MNIRDIAKKSGVSPSTVSRYFTGTEKLSQSSYEKIDKVVKENGYTSVQKHKRTGGLICLLMPEPKYLYHSEVINEIIRQSKDYDFNIIMVPAPKNDFTNFKQLTKKTTISGIIMLDDIMNNELIAIKNKYNMKTVVCGATTQNHNTTAVVINDLGAAYTGMNYLLDLGHKKICILSESPLSIDAGFQRLAGCKKALEEHNVILHEKYIRYGYITYEYGYNLTIELIEEGLDFSAIFAFSDEMAMGVMCALHDKNITIPNDVSVLGFDGLTISTRMRPSLTTIKQPLEDIVRTTLNVFVNNDNQISNALITLPFTLCENGSCSSPSHIKGGYNGLIQKNIN